MLTASNGIVAKPINHSVDQTVEKLKVILNSKGVRTFRPVSLANTGRNTKVWSIPSSNGFLSSVLR